MTHQKLEDFTLEDAKEAVGRIIQAGVSPKTAVCHPLGFIRISIDQVMRNGGSRQEGRFIHLWHPEICKEGEGFSDSESIHSHSFKLRSKILLGGLLNTNYISEQNTNGTHLGVTFNGSGNNRTVEHLGRYNLQISSSSMLRSGDVYTVNQGAIHSTHMVQEDTVTVFDKVGNTATPIVFWEIQGYSTEELSSRISERNITVSNQVYCIDPIPYLYQFIGK